MTYFRPSSFKGRFLIVCIIEWKTHRKESSQFDWNTLKNGHADFWVGNNRKQELDGEKIC